MIQFLPILLLLLLVHIIAVEFARRATPIDGLPYRWGLFIGIATAVYAFSTVFGTISSFRIGAIPEAVVGCLMVLCGVGASVGLIKRARFGVVFGLAFYLQFVVWPLLFMNLRGIPREQQGSVAFPVAVLIATNYVYFKKRWALLT